MLSSYLPPINPTCSLLTRNETTVLHTPYGYWTTYSIFRFFFCFFGFVLFTNFGLAFLHSWSKPCRPSRAFVNAFRMVKIFFFFFASVNFISAHYTHTKRYNTAYSLEKYNGIKLHYVPFSGGWFFSIFFGLFFLLVFVSSLFFFSFYFSSFRSHVLINQF